MLGVGGTAWFFALDDLSNRSSILSLGVYQMGKSRQPVTNYDVKNYDPIKKVQRTAK